MKKSVHLHKFRTELGWFRLASTEKGLAIINFTDPVGFKTDMKRRFGDYQVKAGGVMNKKTKKPDFTKIKLDLNKKFCGESGCFTGGFSKEPPGRRRQKIKEIQ